MNDARSLYVPLFRWAKRRRIVARSPMADFELPTSRHVAREHVPPEVDQLCRYLEAAVEVVPDVAPVLSLGAVTGMRRGELVSLRRSRLFPKAGKLRGRRCVRQRRRVKTTKTRKEREVAIDDADDGHAPAPLRAHGRAGGAVRRRRCPPTAFVFSLEPDCSRPMEADYLTKQVARLKDHLGIADKRPETIALEDEALRLYRSTPAPRRAGQVGPGAGGRDVLQGNRSAARPQRTLGPAGCGVCRTARGSRASEATHGDVRRVDHRPAEVHVQRAARRRVQPLGRSPNDRVTARRCSSSTTPRRARRPTARRPTTLARSSTAASRWRVGGLIVRRTSFLPGRGHCVRRTRRSSLALARA